MNLFTFFIYDIFSENDNRFLTAQVIFYSDYQNFFTFISHHSPELSLALNDYYLIFFSNPTLSFLPSTVFDVFNDNLNLTISEFLEYFILFFSFVWLVILFLYSTRLNK